MGKHRSPVQPQGKHEKKIKRKDSSELETLSPDKMLKYKEILKKQPVVLLEKLPSNISIISNTPNSRVTFSLKTRENAFHGPKIALTSKFVSEISNSQASHKRNKLNFPKHQSSSFGRPQPSTSTKCKDSSRNQNLEKNNSIVSFISTEGSLDEEFAKYDGGFRKSRFSGNIQKICTRDPTRVTPCSDVCCIQFSNPDDEKKKHKRKDKDNISSSKKMSRSQPTFNTSLKTKLNTSQKSTASTSKRKRLKDEKSRKKESDTKADNNLLSSEESSQASLNSCYAIFTKKKNTETSQLSKSNSTRNFYLGCPSNSSMKSSCNMKLFTNRITKRSEYFPDLSIDNLCKSETKTNYPKPTIPKKSQTQMLEASIFPKTSGPNIHTTLKTNLLYTQCNTTYVSPLEYQENELKVTQSENRVENCPKQKENNVLPQTSLSNQNEIPNVTYPENSILMNNHQFDNTVATNRLDDSFRNLSLQRIPENGTFLSEMKLDENVYNFQADNNQPSANNDFHLAREDPTFGGQLSYTESNVRESTLSNIEKEEFLMDDFHFPLLAFDKILDTIDNSIGMRNSENNEPTSSQKKNIKIKDIETIPSNCIQILTRAKPVVKTENTPPDESVTNKTVCEQKKVAVINIQNLEQLRKDEISQSQELYDYNVIGEELISNYLRTSQDVNALVNSSIVDPNNDLLHLNCDDFIDGDIINNNNEKLTSHNEEIISTNLHDIKETFTMEPSASNEMLHLYGQNDNSCLIPVTDNNISKFNDFLDKTNEITLSINHIDNNEEAINGNFELNNTCEFKETVQNSNISNDTEDAVHPRKRKWFNESKKSRSESTKKLKLNRRRWSKTCNESDSLSDSSSEVSSSCLSSLCENENNQSALETSNTIQKEIIDEPKLNIEPRETQIETNPIKINKKIEINSESKLVAVEELQVISEPQPEPEQEELEIQLNRVQETIKCSSPRGKKQSEKEQVRRKKRKRNSKFSPTSFSSDSSSDDECGLKGNSTSDDERVIEDKCGLLKRRFQQDLSYIQSELNAIDDKLSINASSPIKDDQKEDDAISLCASPSLMDLASRCGSPLLDNKTTQSDFSYTEESYWNAFKQKNDSAFDYDLRSYIEKSRNDKIQGNVTKDKQQNKSEIKQEDLFSKPVKNTIANSNVRVNNIKSIIAAPSNSNAYQKTNNSVRTKIEAPSATNNCRANIVKPNIQVPSTSKYNVNNVTSKVEVPSFVNNANNFTTKISVPSTSNGQNSDIFNLSKHFFCICHWFLSNGQCLKNGCHFKHEIPENLLMFQNVSDLMLYSTMSDCIAKRFNYYVNLVYGPVMHKFNYITAVKYFNDMLMKKLINKHNLGITIDILRQKSVPLPKIIEDLSENMQMGHSLLTPLLVFIDLKSLPNEYWESIRCLIWKTVVSIVMLEKVLHQCLNESKNIDRMNDVYKVYTDRRFNEKVSADLWTTFYNVIHIRLNEKSVAQENLHLNIDDPMCIVNNGIASPDPTYQSPSHNNDNSNCEKVQNSIEVNPTNNFPSTVAPNLQNENETSSYSVSLIANVPPPKTIYRDKDNLWKFYDRLQSLRRGLQHRDYNYVANIIQHYATTEKSAFTRHCHRVLCEEIHKSQAHVENIIKAAVQDGELSKMREILSLLGTSVLIELADRELWVYANELLKTLQKYELYKNNAGLTLLAAEIYLANQLLSEAFWLLRESNIIFTNSTRWKVKSIKEDMNLRISVVTLLLDALCQNHAQEAFFIFDLILGEQTSNSYPINLTRIVDKLMLSLIYQNRMDSVMNLCKKAMRYYLNFHEITYRTVITSLVPIDIDLARQFFQYATYLGVYTKINVYPITNVITNIDWSEEEMYLVITEFLRQLSLDAGFAISHIATRQLSAFFVFEAIPSRRELLNDVSDTGSKFTEKKLKLSKAMLKNILETRFDPPITIVKKEQGKICKINGQSLVTYLKSGHINN